MASIPIADVINTERLPIDAQDIITKARLVIAGNTAGEEPWSRATTEYDSSADTTGTAASFLALPLTHEFTDAAHATLGAERSFALPEGTNPFLAPTAIPTTPISTGSMTDAAFITDSDLVTFGGIADLTAGSGTFRYDALTAGVNTFYGFRLVYDLDIAGTNRSTFVTGTPGSISLILSSRDPTFGALGGGGDAGVTYPAFAARYVWAIPETDGQTRELYGLGLFDARVTEDNNGAAPLLYATMSLSMLQQSAGGVFRVFQFYPLHPDAVLLNLIAQDQIRLPAANPQRITVSGIVPPDRTHTIVGWPGGDFTAPVAQHQYELGRTVIDFEQAGAPVGLPAEAIEAARERTVAVKSEIQSAGYSLKMGERQ